MLGERDIHPVKISTMHKCFLGKAILYAHHVKRALDMVWSYSQDIDGCGGTSTHNRKTATESDLAFTDDQAKPLLVNMKRIFETLVHGEVYSSVQDPMGLNQKCEERCCI